MEKEVITGGHGFVLPERIRGLNDLAYNLWWSWRPEAYALFRALDYPRWKLGGHNPVELLRETGQAQLEAAASDPTFLALYDSVIAHFSTDMAKAEAWPRLHCPKLLDGPTAFFSMEFAIHNSLPLYAGGLGILAGDICKEASDLGLPFVCVGFMYPQGYFHQHISADGWQQESYRMLDFDEAPIAPVWSAQGRRSIVRVDLAGRAIYIAVWKLNVGRSVVYLLDANIEDNAPEDRQLSDRLYVADREMRIEQEIVLGIGGVRVLRELGLTPVVWHANEGHTAFMMLERVAEAIREGASFSQAVDGVMASTVFTTHTPVPAGNDVFPLTLVEKYLGDYFDSLGVAREAFLGLGRQDTGGGPVFNMTVLGLNLASQRNGVSRLHGQVARKMWHSLWPELPEERVPIRHVTNGVHLPTWIAPEMKDLYAKHLGADWQERQDDPRTWEAIKEIPDEEVWRVHVLLKNKLMHTILERSQECWSQADCDARKVLAIGALLDQDVLTLGFVRRFTEYKRPALVFQDMERLKRIVCNRWRPVQIVFAGKSHPADFPSKYLLHQVYSAATDREFQGRIAFVEDYDMHMARYLVHGVDVWLNVPRRLQEASGTSGMKAAANGVPSLSVCDGWWAEGYNSANGWEICDREPFPGPEAEDRADADALYRLLEEKIAPLYYERDRTGIPHGWAQLMKETICSITPVFSARRMMKQYAQEMYACPL